jgi:hypothetical protein
MKTSESITEINKALVGFHNDIKQPLKDKANPFFKSKYVPLENIAEVIDEVAPKHGLAYLQEAFTTDTGQTGVVTRLVHESGEFYETEPLVLNADKNNAQGQGSVITYARRYQLASLFGITSDEDDDGNKASENAPSYKQRIDDAYAAIQKVGKMNKTQVDQLIKSELNIQSLSKVDDSDRFQTLSTIYRDILKKAQDAEKNQGSEQTSLMEGNTTKAKGEK